MMFVMRIPIKVTANKIYAGVHWAVRKKLVDEYHQAITNLGLVDKFDLPVRLVVRFYFKNRPLDVSNCFFMVKCIEDGLVRCGVLVDDTPEHVKSITCSSLVDKENPRVEVEIKKTRGGLV